MPYNLLATSVTPAVIIYLFDLSASMGQPMGNKRRINVITEALQYSITRMVFLSTKGKIISPRYQIAMIGYSDKLYDILGGIKGINEVAGMGVPELSPMQTTDTKKGFLAVEKLLQAELHKMKEWPAPLVCHLTDGEYTGEDPEPVVRRIMQMGVPDGNVLVENIFISEHIMSEPIREAHSWSGILENTRLKSDYARKLRRISSKLPESYRLMMMENNYQLDPKAVMMLPGFSPDLIALGFQMAQSTPIR